MPTFVAGKGAAVYVNGVDLTSWFAKSASSKTVEKFDVTTFGQPAKVYIPGQMDQTVQLDGYFDGTASTGIDAQLATLFALDASLFTVLASSDAASARGTGFLGFEAGYDITSEIAGAVKVSMNAQSEVGALGLIVAQTKTTFATIAPTNTGTIHDNTVSSVLGGELHYHVFAVSGTGTPTIRLRWQTSPDQSTWTTIADTGTQGAAPAYGRVTVAPGVTIDRYSRAQVVTAGSTISATAFGAIHRN